MTIDNLINEINKQLENNNLNDINTKINDCKMQLFSVTKDLQEYKQSIYDSNEKITNDEFITYQEELNTLFTKNENTSDLLLSLNNKKIKNSKNKNKLIDINTEFNIDAYKTILKKIILCQKYIKSQTLDIINC